MKSTLKIVFNLENGKTSTVSLLNPKTDLAADEVKAFATDAIDNETIIVDGSKVVALKKAYISTVEEKEIVAES